MKLRPKGLFIGLSTYDIVVKTNKIIEEGVKIDADNLWKGCGGPATNSAIAFSQLGGESHLISRIGNSIFGNQIKNELEKVGVSYTDLENYNSDYEPPISFITVSDTGEKTIVSAINKNLKLKSNIPIDIIQNKSFDIICYDKHLGEKQVDLLKHLKDKPRIYDPGRPSKISFNLLKYANHIIAPDYYEYYELLSELNENTNLRAISRGGENILIFGKNENEINIEKVDVVDTMGAGDILHGAYSYEIAIGNSEIDSLTNASKIASQSTTRWGARII